ncbi:serine protein kinase [Aspergillus sclerotioniger CBS 115572]|uniref:non-specific serine/threonine protein kinase n=1 Tax=Aspergillus sclerotioniger CBS 115572 TaxID=1450535 RepID=A0A317X396_9EURO|nr:serine protein kinase [Aspergillus sclerotioniger CBS 115572]PWY93104.1 serine protein kinase [Aspergillus sclerotioniger CBS 115572]
MFYYDPNLSSVESIDHYHAGGYHPVHLGDIFNEKYKIVGKISHGVYSTVWLAQNQREYVSPPAKCPLSNQEVVLKIIQAAESDLTPEREILDFLNGVRGKHPGHKHVVNLLDHFYHEGANGTHLCLVLPVMAGELQRLYVDGKRRLRARELRRLAKELLQGVDFLHERGVVHCDLHAGNIMLRRTGTINYHDMLKPVVTVPVTWDKEATEDEAKTAPRYLVRSQVSSLRLTKKEFEDVHVVIGDLGAAQWSHECGDLPITPLPLRAPEVIRWGGCPRAFDTKADIWTLGCLVRALSSIFKLATGKILFPVDRKEDMKADESQLALIEQRVGSQGRETFAKYLATQLPRDFGEENAKLLAEFLLLMLQINPQKRRSAVSLQRTRFIRNED